MCEICAIALWTFPLVCCLIVLLFKTWDFCESRLYYECLRQRIFVNRSPKDFFSHPIIAFLFVYMIVGLSSVVFSAPRSTKGWQNMVNAMLPFAFPVISFFIALYVSWDPRFKLIQLNQWLLQDFEWCQGQMRDGVHVDQIVVHLAFVRLRAEGRIHRFNNSAAVFGALRQRCVELKRDEELMRRLDEEKEDFEEIRVSNTTKLLGLAFGLRGFWVKDLLWLPNDVRAHEFVRVFRVSNGLALILETLLVAVGVCTVLQYLRMQGHLSPESIPDGFFLFEKFMVRHTPPAH